MKLRAITLCGALAVLAGCQKDSGTAPAATRAAHARAQASAHGPTPEEMTAGMVEAVTQGRSQAPVSMKFDLPSRPVEGQPLQVAIALLPQIAAGRATVDVSASDGLQLATADSEFEFASVDPTQVYRHSIQVTAAAEGVYLLTLNVSLKHDPFDDTRVFSVPIIVGSAIDAPADAPANVPAKGQGEAAAPPTSALQPRGPFRGP
jgi:hypothetical protein